jgi:hypothetical protein
VKLGELTRVISTHVGKEQAFVAHPDGIGCDFDIEPVGLAHRPPTVEMEAVGVAPPTVV